MASPFAYGDIFSCRLRLRAQQKFPNKLRKIYNPNSPGQRAVRSLIFDQLQVQLINELAEVGITVNHLLEYLAA